MAANKRHGARGHKRGRGEGGAGECSIGVGEAEERARRKREEAKKNPYVESEEEVQGVFWGSGNL